MIRFNHALSLAVLLGVLCLPLAGQARTLALVVGINHYSVAAQREFGDLAGAVNDARTVAAALRSNGVDLPESRFLIDGDATRERVFLAWRQMVKAAEPGDTLVFSFAGHGGQEEEFGPPWDERDRRDETLMLADFDPAHPENGRISDDELQTLFADASDYRILFIADTCHAAGLTRSLRTKPLGRSRYGGVHKVKVPPAEDAAPHPLQGEEGHRLAHVTYLTANNDEALEIHETFVDGQSHGALSWYFAKALNGGVPLGPRGQLSGVDLEAYLTAHVGAEMNNTQYPQLVPRGSSQSVLTLGKLSAPPPPTEQPVLIQVQQGGQPGGLRDVRQAEAQPARLRFATEGGKTRVYNSQGDQLTSIDYSQRAWQRVVDRELLLMAIDRAYRPDLRPVSITLAEGDQLHLSGARLSFSVEPAGNPELTALTLFNLAGNGELQFLYPLAAYRDPERVQSYPYQLPPFQVQPPYGGDQLVAVLCRQPPRRLHRLLAEHDGSRVPTGRALLQSLQGQTCQAGRYGFFTAAGKP